MRKTMIFNRISVMAIVLFMFLILFSKLEFITANGIGHSLTFKTDFEINEYSSFNDNLIEKGIFQPTKK